MGNEVKSANWSGLVMGISPLNPIWGMAQQPFIWKDAAAQPAKAPQKDGSSPDGQKPKLQIS